MDGNEIFSQLLNSGSVAIILFILSFIKIPKIEVNIWGLIGKSLTKDISNKIDTLEKSVKDVDEKLDEHIEKEQEREATTARQRILRFNDEIIDGREHSKEHYEDMIRHIDTYENYCETHPDYPNNKCMLAIENIKETYHNKCMEKIAKPRKTRKKKEQ